MVLICFFVKELLYVFFITIQLAKVSGCCDP